MLKIYMVILVLLIAVTTNIIAQENNNNKYLILTLDQCIEITLKNNVSRNISNSAIKAAEAQLKQANSGRYPAVDITTGYSLISHDMNFIQPEMSFEIPPINLGTFTLVPGSISVPPQDIKIADKQTIAANLEVLFPLYTGGKISSYISQAEAAIEIAKSNSLGNDQQIIFETKKMYYATLLASKLEEIANEAYERLNSTLKVTESTYKNGSGRVTKSDYLKNKMFAETIKSIWIQISGEKKNALAALAHAMGLDWKTQIQISETDFHIINETNNLEELINLAISHNPLFSKVENGLKVYESKIDLAKSDLYPSVALFGGYRKLFNSYDYGMMTKENKSIWNVGVGLQLNIFNGFKTLGMIEEAKANLDIISGQKEQLTKGVSLKVQYLFNKIQTAKEKESSCKEAMQAAIDDKELVEKAYFSDIMELKDFMQAQIAESLMKAQYVTSRYERALQQAEMQSVIASDNL
jgi:outer membrane protein